MRRCTGKSATPSRPSQHSSGAPGSRCFHARSRAATATSNSSSARAVVERLVIDHVGHFGDGVALLDGASVYVPYTLGGETVEAAPAPGRQPPPPAAAAGGRRGAPRAHPPP